MVISAAGVDTSWLSVLHVQSHANFFTLEHLLIAMLSLAQFRRQDHALVKACDWSEIYICSMNLSHAEITRNTDIKLNELHPKPEEEPL